MNVSRELWFKAILYRLPNDGGFVVTDNLFMFNVKGSTALQAVKAYGRRLQRVKLEELEEAML